MKDCANLRELSAGLVFYQATIQHREEAAMWATIAGVAIILAQAAQPLGPGSKGQEWCFDRGQGAQLCEATEAECNRLRGVNTEIAQSPCRHVEPPEIQQSPTEPPAPPNPARQTPTQR